MQIPLDSRIPFPKDGLRGSHKDLTQARGFSFEMEDDTEARTRKTAIAKDEKAETS